MTLPAFIMQDRIVGDTTDTRLFWMVDGAYLDLSSGYTFSTTCTDSITGTSAAGTWPKVTGHTGGVGSATVPSVVIDWTASDLGSATAGTYNVTVTATNGALIRKVRGSVQIVS